MPDTFIREHERVEVVRSLGLLEAASSEDFDSITRLAAQCFGVPMALITLVDDKKQFSLSRVGLDFSELPKEHSICAHAIQQRERVMEIEDLRQDPRFMHNPLVTDKPGMRFYAGAPLITDSGHAIGALCISDYVPRQLTQAQRDQLVDLSRIVMDRVALRQSVGRRDAVSGLPNRQQLVNDLDALVRMETPGGRLFVLIDVIDLHSAYEMAQAVGIPVIESLLRHAAQQLRAVLPHDVALYHVGVARFAFWYDPETEPDLVQRLQAGTVEPLQAAGVLIQLRLHCGTVPFEFADVVPTDLLRKSMIAIGGAIIANVPVAEYDPDDDAKLRRRYLLALDLRHAVQQEQFYLVFQPRVDIRSGEVRSLEALIRWRHPLMGNIGPCEFIPIVERTGMMQPLTLWVVEASLQALQRWQAEFPELTISVNLSPRDFDNERLVPSIRAICERMGMNLSHLEFEVTEGEWLRVSPSAVRQMDELVAASARLAIDDFGAGYSNFAYMAEIPASVLKIDQSLVHDSVESERHAILVRDVLGLARKLGYRTVAEGVETAAVYEFIAGCGCDEVQGYYFSRPLAAGDVPAFLRDFRMPGG